MEIVIRIAAVLRRTRRACDRTCVCKSRRQASAGIIISRNGISVAYSPILVYFPGRARIIGKPLTVLNRKPPTVSSSHLPFSNHNVTHWQARMRYVTQFQFVVLSPTCLASEGGVCICWKKRFAFEDFQASD
ncbi:uncharacterized protein C8R40DRAFT_823075 [Lentinula edodes]|uniref:uncharacterized protein n=1 Tax=Lentinula edodes TaxID=5353 RepID=UPI001E8E4066|nr:uncharacterized protein C8R40DRAFT_823075 [Lentinula edodes]KAH7868535.1 hypothetical protein C8R40DRAFT_823075 [Lentinula edodes]